jgi:hypothetical protein
MENECLCIMTCPIATPCLLIAYVIMYRRHQGGSHQLVDQNICILDQVRIWVYDSGRCLEAYHEKWPHIH